MSFEGEQESIACSQLSSNMAMLKLKRKTGGTNVVPVAEPATPGRRSYLHWCVFRDVLQYLSAFKRYYETTQDHVGVNFLFASPNNVGKEKHGN